METREAEGLPDVAFCDMLYAAETFYNVVRDLLRHIDRGHPRFLLEFQGCPYFWKLNNLHIQEFRNRIEDVIERSWDTEAVGGSYNGPFMDETPIWEEGAQARWRSGSRIEKGERDEHWQSWD